MIRLLDSGSKFLSGTAIVVFAPASKVEKWENGEKINPELPKMPEEFVKYQEELQGKSVKFANFAGDSETKDRLFNMYKEYKEYKSGGKIEIINGYVKKSDHKDLISISRFYAKNGANGSIHRNIKKNIYNRVINEKQAIDEVLVYEKGNVYLIYEKQ